MKQLTLLFFALGVAVSGCIASPMSEVLLVQANMDKIAQVKTGHIQEARASWWGFDSDDSTQALQDAIDSGVPKLIVDKMESDWIISKTIRLVSNQEIIFQDGVVIQAKKGEFKSRSASLLTGSKIRNTSLVGEGDVIFRMQREDYANPALYTNSEHRHGIALRNCENILLRNLTVEGTGGDGLYIGATSDTGYSKNILVEDCVFDKNYRQGISVISVEDFTVRNSKIINTEGTPPQAGIDFEPNRVGQRLINCRVEDTEISGNAGSGIEINVNSFDGTTLPTSISVIRCNITNNAKKPVNILVTRSSDNPAKGKLLFDECNFTSGGIYMEGLVENTLESIFKNSTLEYTDDESRLSPIILRTGPGMAKPIIGGIRFENMVIKMSAGLPPIDFQIQRQGNVSDSISGELFITRDGVVTPLDLKKFVAGQQEYFAQRNAAEPDLAVLDLTTLRAPASGAQRRENEEFYLRSNFTFLQYAQKGETVSIHVRVKKVYERDTGVTLHDPTGKELGSYIIPYNNKPVPINFTAEETGYYQIKRTQSSSQRVDITSANPGNGIVAEEGVDFIPGKGSLYFEVPPGIKNFAIGVSTNSPDAPAEVALIDSSGKEVERQTIKQETQVFTVERNNASHSEIWSIKVLSAAWTVTVYPYQGLTGVVSTNPATLLLQEK